MLEENNPDLYFLPVKANHYIDSLAYEISESSSYYAYNMTIVLSKVINTFVYEYDDKGQLTGYYIYEGDDLAISFELIESWVDYSSQITQISFVCIVTSLIMGLIYFHSRKQKKSTMITKKFKKLIRNSRN